MKNADSQLEFKTGVFVLSGLILTALAILMLGSKEKLLSSVNHYEAHFPKIDGLVNGAKVELGGLQIGVVGKIEFDEKQRDIGIYFTAETKYAQWIRKDSTIEIVTEGVLGDKYLSVIPGSMEQPIIENYGTISTGNTKDISQLFTSSEQLMANLNATALNLNKVLESLNRGNRADSIFQGLSATAKNLGEMSGKLNKEVDDLKIKSAVTHLNSILEKVDRGQGSIGALINDPALYDDLKALVGQVNHNRVMRNVIRQTIKDHKAEPGKE